MRDLIALAILLVLIGTGWHQSYSSHMDRLMGNTPAKATPAPAKATPTSGEAEPESGAAARIKAIVKATPAPAGSDRSWMFKKTKMDAPYDKRGLNAQ